MNKKARKEQTREKEKGSYQKVLTKTLLTWLNVLVTLKALHVHSNFPKKKVFYTFWLHKPLEDSVENKSFHEKCLYWVTYLTVFMQFLSVHKVTTTLPEELAKFYPPLLHETWDFWYLFRFQSTFWI